MNDALDNRGCLMPGLWAVGALFIALKLSGHVTWSWLWVTAPFWVGPVAGLSITLLFLLALLIFTGFALGAACFFAVIDEVRKQFQQ